jgi:hypothetical protein
MASISTPVVSSAASATRQLPAVTVPLVVLGILLGTGMTERVSLTRPAGIVATDEASVALRTPPAEARDVHAWRDRWGGTGGTANVGRMAIGQPVGDPTTTSAALVNGGAVDVRRPECIDRFAAAMFGPPDRQPPPILADGTWCWEQGAARGYLEWTAVARWMTPWDRAILARSYYFG